MSGSFYALNSKYNSLLAILDDIQGDASPQGLASVLDVSDDGGNLNMTNVNTLTVDTINYQTLNPPVPAHIGNISQVLAVGNDATNQSIVNMGSVVLKNGGGGVITFADGTTQSTAFTGTATTPDLTAVLAVGSNANGSIITNIQGLSTGGANPLSLASFNQQDINLVAYPSGVADSGSVVISTAPTGGSQQAWSFNGDNTVDLPTNSSLDFGGGSTIKEDGDLEIEGGSGNVVIVGDLQLEAGGGGGLFFQDGTEQTTAFTGAVVPPLNSVLLAGNTAGGQSITALNDVGLTTINGSAYPPVVAPDTLNAVLLAGNTAGGQSITGINNIGLTTINGGVYPPVVPADTLNAVLLAGSTAGGQSITGINNIGLTTINGGVYPPVVPADTISAVLSAGSVASSQPITGLTNVGTTQITFGDATVQTTAYTGTAGGDQDLASVLGVGADGANIPMTSVGNMSATNWTLGGVGGGSIDSYLTNEQTGGTLFINTQNFPFGTVQSLAIDGGTNGAVFGVSVDMNGNFIQGVPNIITNSNSVVFTDDVETRSGTALTLLGTNMGTASGTGGIGIGVGAFNSGALANNSIAIGTNVAVEGTGVGSIALGNYAGGKPNSVAQGAGAIAIGTTSGSGASGVAGLGQSTNAVALGAGAGGAGQNASAVAIGANSGMGTSNTVSQGSNSICLGNNSGLGYGTGGVPANSLTISSMRTSTTASNFLTYNTTTKEVSNIASINITPNTFAIGINTGVSAGSDTFASGENTGNNASYTSYASGINSGNDTTGNQTSIGIGAGNNSGQSVCIGLNAGIGTFNATCIGNSAGSIGLGFNSVAIGTNASPTNGSADSICIVGDGVTVNPPNSGLFISPIRSAVSATNQLTYNTTTKEIQYAPSGGGGGLTYVSTTFTSVPLSWGFGGSTFTGGGLVLTAGTWAITGFYSIVSGSAVGGQVMNGSSFYFSNGSFQYGSNSTDLYTTETTINTSLTKTHNISYIVTIPSTQTMIGETTIGGYSGGIGLNGSGAFYAIQLA